MNKLVSVIIPIYNVRNYLNRCVESIINQTYRNLEIILVDDGSTDGSDLICEKYRADSRVRVIHKLNGGLSDARNAGLDICIGDYIFFLDADDYVESNAIEVLLNTATLYNADIVECKVRHFFIEDGEEYISKRPIVGTYNHDEAIEAILDYKFRIVAWNKLYKRNLWSEIRFPIGKYHEDEFTTPYIVDLCNKYIVLDNVLYNYLQRKGSIMHTAFDNRRLSILDAYADRFEYFSTKYGGKYDDIMNFHKYSVLLMLVVNAKKVDGYREIKHEFYNLGGKLLKSAAIPYKRKLKVLAAKLLPEIAYKCTELQVYKSGGYKE